MQKLEQLDAQSQEMLAALNKLYSQYGKYALSDEEARKIVDQAMGTRSLTEALGEMREG